MEKDNWNAYRSQINSLTWAKSCQNSFPIYLLQGISMKTKVIRCSLFNRAPLCYQCNFIPCNKKLNNELICVVNFKHTASLELTKQLQNLSFVTNNRNNFSEWSVKLQLIKNGQKKYLSFLREGDNYLRDSGI